MSFWPTLCHFAGLYVIFEHSMSFLSSEGVLYVMPSLSFDPICSYPATG